MRKKEKENRTFIVAIVVAIVFFLAIFVPKINSREVCYGNKCYKVEIADTLAERTYGLSYREELASDSGMFFIFETQGKHTFWMRNTNIPLDIIWLDRGGKIVYIKERAVPCGGDPCELYAPDEQAMYVLEIKAGEVEKTEIEVGDKLIFKNIK